MRGSYERFIKFSPQFVHVSHYKHILDQFGAKLRCAAASSRGTKTTACLYIIPLNPLAGVETKTRGGLQDCAFACLQRLQSFALFALFPAFPHVGNVFVSLAMFSFRSAFLRRSERRFSGGLKYVFKAFLNAF